MSYNNYPYPEQQEQQDEDEDQTDLPPNLDYLPREEVLNLLKRVASDRDRLIAEHNKKESNSKKPRGSSNHNQNNNNYSTIQQQHSVLPAATQQAGFIQPYAYAAAALSPAAPFDAIVTKKRIFKNASSQIKKTVHSERNKPTTDVLDCVSSEHSIMALMDGYLPTKTTSNNSAMTWILDTNQVLDWFNIHENPYIHPVANRIKTIYFAGSKPNVYAHVAIDNLDIKWERKTGTLRLRFQTAVVGTGRPPHFEPNDPVYMPKRGPNGKFEKVNTRV